MQYNLKTIFGIANCLLAVLVFGQCRAQMDTAMLTAARVVIDSAQYCALITTDSTGRIHARAMDPFPPEKDFTIWLATNPRSAKVKQLQQNPMATLYYFDPKMGAYVTVQGKATLHNDASLKQQYWKKGWENFYKSRETDYLLIEFSPTTLHMISEKEKILGDSSTWATPIYHFKKQ